MCSSDLPGGVCPGICLDGSIVTNSLLDSGVGGITCGVLDQLLKGTLQISKGNQLATMAIRNLCGCGPPSSAPTVKMTPHAKGGGGSAKGGSGGGNGKGGGGGTNNQDKGMMTMSGHQLRFGHFEEHFSFRASRGLAV